MRFSFRIAFNSPLIQFLSHSQLAVATWDSNRYNEERRPIGPMEDRDLRWPVVICDEMYSKIAAEIFKLKSVDSAEREVV